MNTSNTVSMEMPTRVGMFHFYVWKGERGREMVALTTLSIDPSKEVMLRIHSECLSADVFHSLTCDCGAQKDMALEKIHEHGNGIFIYHRQEGRNAGLFNKVRVYHLMQRGIDTHQALLSIVGHPDPREYSEVLTILDLLLDGKKSKIRLLTYNPYKALFLQRHYYEATIEPLRAGSSVHDITYTETKTQKFLHNTVGYAPYTSVTVSRADLQQRLGDISNVLLATHPFAAGRKLFIGVGVYPEKGDLHDPRLLHELEDLQTHVSKVENAYIVLHMDYPQSRSMQRELKRFLGKLSFPFSLQFRLAKNTESGMRVDVELIDSFHGEHVIFQLKEEHLNLLEQKSFADYFSSPNKYVLLDESWAKGTREDVAVRKDRMLKLISRGLSRIAVAGGYAADNTAEIHELEDYFKIPISVDAESGLKTHGYLDSSKAKAYLSFFFHPTT